MPTKNETIKLHVKETRARRKSMACKTFCFKVDRSNLSKAQKDYLEMMFIEAKWLYNYLIANSDNPDVDITNAMSYKKYYNITHKDKDGNDVAVELTHLGSSVMQGVFDVIKFNITGLSRAKKKGYNVGRLRFKSECKSLFFKQHGVSHSLRGNKLKIQGIKKPVRVLGTKQLKRYPDIELTTMNLLYDGIDWYAKITCFYYKQQNDHFQDRCYRGEAIGLDFGVSTTVTLSNGEKYDFSFEETDRIKSLQKQLARKTRMSNNWKKVKSKLDKAYARVINKKEDAANKLVHHLVTEYEHVITQDDNLSQWHKKDHIKDKKPQKMQHSILGRVKAKLKRQSNVVFLEKWLPTTKMCTECGHKEENMTLQDRVFVCHNCGYTLDRDEHAAENMVWFWRHKIYTGKELASVLPTLFGGKEESIRSLA